ncbi:MAG: DNA repair protein RecN [Zoogloeaceae bacterium]|nr:DNA repair protein RecN [Zoogloeaceae bacterium]
MLQRLSIRDFVLVDQLELEFLTGFGALTGETGAGKSILVDALAFVLGERADAGLLRFGAERAEVAAEFDVTTIADAFAWLKENEMDDDDAGTLVLRRTLDAGGRSRVWINGSPSTVQQLKELGQSLVDIHGQHAHQSLLRADAQRRLLDQHAGLQALVARVADAWRQWRDAQAARDAAAGNSEASAREREELTWKIEEIEVLAFTVDGWETLNQEHRRLAHAAALIEGVQQVLVVLAEGEDACESRIGGVASRLDDLTEYDPELNEIARLVQSAQTELVEVVSSLRRYADRAELDPARLSAVEQQIEQVLACARKLRVQPEALPEVLSDARKRLLALGESADIEALESRVLKAAATYSTAATELSSRRQAAATEFSHAVSAGMQHLALAGGRFDVVLLPLPEGSAHGLEQIEFRVAGLAGDEPRALAKVVSGGELSRISLAIQVVASRAASVPTLVFDEVDVGIGGGVAEVVGRLLAEIATDRQVLCVTHLPQVAARAGWQWQVSKDGTGNGVVSRVTALDDAGRVEEIARMLGGVEITTITRQHAQEMLVAS